MAVTFLLGRAGSGKTARCVRKVLEALRDKHDSRRLVLIVPEQASFQMERTLATHAPGNGYSRAAVLSFSRLAQQVWNDLGIQPPLISPGARALALRNVTARLADQLPTLRPALRRHGFIVQLESLIEELLREDVMPEDFRRAAATLPDGRARSKAEEIATIHAAYLDWLGPHRVDPALRLRLLRERLEQLPWLNQAAIWVDGFAGFTGQETLTLVALARRARELHVTLLLDPELAALDREPDNLHLFRRTVKTYRDLRAQFEAAGAEVIGDMPLTPTLSPRYSSSSSLARLEAGLAGARLPENMPADATPHVRVLQCQTHRDEARQAARHIRGRVIESAGALRFRDFAVVARDLTPLADTLAEVFDDYGIPYFLDRRRPLRGHPLSRLVHGVLEAAVSDYSVSSMTRLLRTGLLPLAQDEAEVLESVLVEHEVRGAATWRRKAWDFTAGHTLFDVARRSVQSDFTHDARLRIVAALDPLWQLVRQDEPADGATWARRIYDCLADLDVRRHVERWVLAAQRDHEWEAAELHRLAWDAICRMFDDLHAVLGETPAHAGEVMRILSASIAETTLGLAPPTLDQVLVSSIDRSRHPDIKHAWIIGFNEGLFPKRPAEDTLLTTAERQTLVDAGLSAPRPRRDDAFDERMLAYIALTRASHELTISFAAIDEEGRELPASSLLADVRRALPELEPVPCESGAPPTTMHEFAREDLAARASASSSSALIERCDRLRKTLAGDARQAEKLARLTRGRRYSNAPARIGDYGKPSDDRQVVLTTSPSELETYLQCPFKHFARHGLRLEEQRGTTPLSRDLGSLTHAVLARVTRMAIASKESVADLKDERWLAWLDDVNAELEREWLPDLMRRRPERAFLIRMLGQQLRDVLLAHADRWRRGSFRPLASELKFGGGDDELPPLLVEIADGQRVHVRGSVDRVDICSGGQGEPDWLVLYDYKTKASSSSPPYLTGERLQLMTYAAAMTKAFVDQGRRVAGMFLARWSPDLDVLERVYAQDLDERELRMHLYRPRGVFAREIGQRLDQQLGVRISPVANMKLKKDGDFDGRYRDVMPLEDVMLWMALAVRTVATAADGIVAGTIDVAPLLEGRRLPCRWCPYASVCRNDRHFNRPRVAEIVLPMLDTLGKSTRKGGK